MAKLASSLSTKSDAYRNNRDANLTHLKTVQDAVDLALAGGGAASRERHVSRGKLLPRDRVQSLLDPGSPWLEIGATAAHGMYRGDSPCASIIAGIGRVSGREAMIVCNDATVKRHPGQEKTGRQMTVSSDLIYDVLREHEPDHILLQATRQEAAFGLLDVRRLGDMLKRIKGHLVHRGLDRISPLAVPIMLEVGRETIEGEAEDALLAEAADELFADIAAGL